MCCPEGFLRNWLSTAKMTACTAIINTVTTANVWIWIHLFHCFLMFFVILLWWRILHRYASTNRRRTDTFTQISFYVQIFFHREVCAQISFYAQMPLHTEVFTQKKYTKKLHTDVLHKDVFARINKGTQALLHTEPFTQRNLCTEQFLHNETLTREKFDTKNLSTQTAQRNFYTQNLYPDQLLHTHTHTFFSAQKPVFTEVFMHNIFFTGTFTHRCLYTEKTILHTETCAHSTFLHSQFLLHGGFVSLSWSPTFRVPLLNYIYTYTYISYFLYTKYFLDYIIYVLYII